MANHESNRRWRVTVEDLDNQSFHQLIQFIGEHLRVEFTAAMMTSLVEQEATFSESLSRDKSLPEELQPYAGISFDEFATTLASLLADSDSPLDVKAPNLLLRTGLASREDGVMPEIARAFATASSVKGFYRHLHKLNQKKTTSDHPYWQGTISYDRIYVRNMGHQTFMIIKKTIEHILEQQKK